MPVDAALLAELAMGAAKKPVWKAPPATAVGPKITSQSQEGQYHPRLDVVENALRNLSAPADRASVLTARLAWVQKRKAAAETALQAIGVSTALPATLTPTQVTATEWPLTHADRRVTDLPFRLFAGQKKTVEGEVYDTDKALAALTDGTVITTAAAQAVSSANLLLQMRCLSDIYARWEMAARVTSSVIGAQLATPALSNQEMLARVLTYGRIEGDLSVPPEEDTLAGTDPGGDANQIGLPPGRSRFWPDLNPSAYLFCVTYLVQQRVFGAFWLPDAVPGLPVKWDLSMSGIRMQLADISFTAALGGLDILWIQPFQLAAENLVSPSGGTPFTVKDRFDWPALNRQMPASISHDDARTAAQDDYKTRLDLLTDSTIGPASAQASRITPVGASDFTGSPYSGAGVQYLGLVLSEGVRYLNRLTYGPTRFGAGAATRLPEILVYLLYHTGGDCAGLLASAAANALRPESKSSYAQDLGAALNSAGLTASLHGTLNKVWHNPTTRGAVRIATDNWAAIAPLLGNEEVVTALANYIRNESDSVWTGWNTPEVPHGPTIRSNCVGYAQLYEYLIDQIA
jgi:hypothetical protein